MINFFKRQHTGVPDFKSILQQKAMIIDVRTPAEFAMGHIEGSKNISLDQISFVLPEIRNLKVPIITCCRSGIRSNAAVSLLKSAGVDAYNGGSWYDLQKKI